MSGALLRSTPGVYHFNSTDPALDGCGTSANNSMTAMLLRNVLAKGRIPDNLRFNQIEYTASPSPCLQADRWYLESCMLLFPRD